MRYMYEIPEEKYVPNPPEEYVREVKVPLRTFKFRVHPQLEGIKRIPRNRVPRRLWSTPDTLVELCGNVVNHIPLPDAFSWTNVDVSKWLNKLGFSEYRNAFFQNNINGRTLLLVNAAALQAMNIKNYDHIQAITKAIRDLYQVELVLFNRSISLPPYYPMTHYKLYRVQTGPKYELTRPTDLWRKMKILRDPPANENHWITLENWLKHIPNYQKERIGYAPRRDLYKVRKAPLEKVQIKKPNWKTKCECLPPCECQWTEKDTRLPWKLAYLKEHLPIEEDDAYVMILSSEFEEGQNEEEISEEGKISEYSQIAEPCKCIPPCECKWTEKDYKESSVLNILKLKMTRRYSSYISSINVRSSSDSK